MPEISYRFRAYGAADVARGYDTISAAARRAKRDAGDYGRVAARGGIGGGSGGRAMVRETERLAQQVAKAQEKAAQQATKAQERANKQQQRMAVDHARFLASVRERSMRAEQRMRNDAERQERVAQRKRERDMARYQREQYKAATRGQRFEARKAEVRQNSMMGGIAGIVGGMGIMGLVGGVASGIGAAASWEFGMMKQAADQREMRMARARALSTSARGAGATAVDPTTLMNEANATARAVRGTKADAVLEAQQRFVSMTGDLEGARRNSRTFAIAARATGAQDADIASTAATLRDKFGVSDDKEMKTALARLTFQGKSGAFEMGDASRYFTELGAAGQRFGLDKGVGGIATLGGLAQIARMSTGSGAEASTATQAMLRQLVAKAEGGKDSIKSLTGASVFTDKTRTKTRDVQDILVDVIGGAGGDLTKMQKIFGEEGIAGVSKLVSTFNEAANAAGKDATASERRAAGEQAVRKMLDQTINAGGDWGEVLKDAAANTDGYTDKLSTAFDGLMADLGDAVGPAAESLAAALTAIIDSSGPLIDSVGDMADSFGGFVKFLQNKGLIPKNEGTEGKPKSERPDLDLARNVKEQGELEKKKKQYGGLSTKDRRRLAVLKEEAIGLRERADGFNSPDFFDPLSDQEKRIGKGNLLFNRMALDDGDSLGVGGGALKDASMLANKSAESMSGYDTATLQERATQASFKSFGGAGSLGGMLFGANMMKDMSNLGGSGQNLDQVNEAMRAIVKAAQAQEASAKSMESAAATIGKSAPPGAPVVVKG